MISKATACVAIAVCAVSGGGFVAVVLPYLFGDATGSLLFWLSAVLSFVLINAIAVGIFVAATWDTTVEMWWRRHAAAPSEEPPSPSRQFLDPHRPSDDPLADVLEPMMRRPGGKSSAAAVPEPDYDVAPVDAVARA
jgi:hypothetical protein